MNQKGSPRGEAGVIHLLIPILVLIGAGILVGSNMTTTVKFPDDPNVYGLIVKGEGSGNSDSNRGKSEERRNNENSGSGNASSQDRENKGPSENSNRGGVKTKVEIRNGIVVSETEIEDEDVEDEEEDELEDEDNGEEESTPSASPNHQLENRIRSISKFPLRIDTSTNQLIMTKNGVERVLTVLPEHAVQNMLRAHLKKGLGPKFFGILSPSASPSASPTASPSASPDASPSTSPDASPSATPEATPPPEASESAGITVLDSQIKLEEKDGRFVYKIPALKHLRVLGLIPVTTQFTAFVSAETGNLLEEQQSLLARILDLLSP